MANLKCKFCGGSVSAFPDSALGTCSRCGATMTMPRDSSPKRISLHNGANYFRRDGNFEKALAVYQSILKQDATDAEASFGSALCRFGVEYAPTEDGFVPVCHKKCNGSFLESGDYLAAIANSFGAVQLQYEREGARIAQAQKAPASPAQSAGLGGGAPLLSQAFGQLSDGNWEKAALLCDQALKLDSDNAAAYLGKLLAQLHCRQPKDLGNCRTSFADNQNYKSLMAVADPELRNAIEACLRKIEKRNRLAQAETYYRRAKAAMNNANEEQLHQISRAFRQLGSYRDSQQLSQECLNKAEALRKEGVYRRAVQTQEQASSAEGFRQAAALFAKVPGWRDANVRQVACKQEAEAHEAMEPKDSYLESWLKKAVATMAVILILLVGGYLLFTQYILPQGKYDKAEALLEANEKELAIAGFQELGDFRDARQRAIDIQQSWYDEAVTLLSNNDVAQAAAIFGGLRDYEDARQRSRTLWDTIVTPQHICAGGWFTAGILGNGTAAAIGANQERQCNLGSWYDLTSISAGWAHTAGLKSDGTVITAGYNGDGRGGTAEWKDIVAISLGQWHTVGLRSNGRVLAIGCTNDGRTDVDSWRNIIAISAGRHHTLGLRADGTLEAVGSNEYGQCSIDSWQNITSIAAGGDHSLGLRADGTLLATGSNQDGQCDIDSWQDIVSIAAGFYHSVGLKADGTVVAAGFNDYGQCDVDGWTDIVAIAAGGWHTVGLRADGTVVATGRNVDGQCDTGLWTGMLLPGQQAGPVG